MTTMPRTPTDTSVSISLAELARIEEQRVREEDLRRARARENEARERREVEAKRRAAEAESMAAEEAARARRLREEAEHKARVEARERVAADVARIEAEASARRAADNAVRAHELAVLRARAEGGSRRVQHVLAIVLGLTLCGGAAAGYGMTRQVAGLEQETERLRESQVALSREREQAKSNELAALDRRHAALQGRPALAGAEEARAAVEAARNAVDSRALDRDRLRAYGDALDALAMRLDTLERIAALDRRQADLGAWAADRRRSDEATAARVASLKAKAPGAGPDAVRAYERALDQLRDALAASGPARGSRPPPAVRPWDCKDPADPICGLDGRTL